MKMKRQKIRKTIQLVSALLFPITLNYFSPYLIVQGSYEGVLAGSGVLFAGLFLSSLFFGRGFCGWLCPAGALQDFCTAIVDKPAGRRQDRIKFFLWIPWLAAILLGFVSAGGLQRIDIVYYTDYGISVSAPGNYVVYFSVVGLIVVLAMTLGRRSFCHCACWMAPFMIIGNFVKERLRIPALRLQCIPSRCVDCGSCDRHCPMSLPVSLAVKSGSVFQRECILCGNCADCCPKDAIRMRMGSVQHEALSIAVTQQQR
jgi:ferredoxin-type protein NapH